jgi:hypothetical protein
MMATISRSGKMPGRNRRIRRRLLRSAIVVGITMQAGSSLAINLNVMSPAVGSAETIFRVPSSREKMFRLLREILCCVIVMLLLTGGRAIPVGAQNPATDEDVQTFRIYPTEEGDTLRSIAGRKDVLRNPLRWILLYRLNRDELARFKVSPARLADVSLPAGLNIIYISPEEARKQAVKKIAEKSWVLNLYSDKKVRKVESLAAHLVAKGYNAYIIRLDSKKTSLYYLRAGFFANRDQAAESGRRMIKALGLPQFRVLKARVGEIREFSGYTD